MNFEFSSTQKQLRDEVRGLLAQHCKSADVRLVLDGEQTYSAAIWKQLTDLGLTGAAIDEEFGGAGAGYLELCVIAEELGRALAPVPFSSCFYLAAEALKLAGGPAQASYLPGLASGKRIGTLALLEGPGACDPRKVNARYHKGKLSGRKTPVPDGSSADFAIVAARDEAQAGSIRLCAVDLTQRGVERCTLDTIDPTRDLATLDFTDVPAEPIGEWDLTERVLDRAAVLFAFEQLGGAERALEMAVDYAKQRFAFGRPIGSFQAIKHMLADMYVAVELARSNCYHAGWALSVGASELPLAAATARLAATKAYQLCSKDNIQVHGGVGFTWALDCHLHYRRSNLLALCIGSPSVWEGRIVDALEAEFRSHRE